MGLLSKYSWWQYLSFTVAFFASVFSLIFGHEDGAIIFGVIAALWAIPFVGTVFEGTGKNEE